MKRARRNKFWKSWSCKKLKKNSKKERNEEKRTPKEWKCSTSCKQLDNLIRSSSKSDGDIEIQQKSSQSRDEVKRTERNNRRDSKFGQKLLIARIRGSRKQPWIKL